MRSSGGVASHALELAAVAEEISMGYMDVLQKRPVAGTYSHHTAGVRTELHVRVVQTSALTKQREAELSETTLRKAGSLQLQ